MSEVIQISRTRKPAPEPEALPRGVAIDTDLANGHRLFRMYGERLRYVHLMGIWLDWTDYHWKRDDTCAAERKAHKVGRGLEVRASELYAYAASIDDDDTRKRVRAEADVSVHAPISSCRKWIDRRIRS